MKNFDHQWQKLTALARQAPDNRDTAAPLGFATRMAARAADAPAGSSWAVLERFALRGLVMAAVVGVAAIVLDYSGPKPEPADGYVATDTVSDLIDLS